MTKKRRNNIQLERPQLTFKAAEITNEALENNELEIEIPCPSCQSIMNLYSVSESPYYSCDDCKFSLYMYGNN